MMIKNPVVWKLIWYYEITVIIGNVMIWVVWRIPCLLSNYKKIYIVCMFINQIWEIKYVLTFHVIDTFLIICPL